MDTDFHGYRKIHPFLSVFHPRESVARNPLLRLGRVCKSPGFTFSAVITLTLGIGLRGLPFFGAGTFRIYLLLEVSVRM